MTDEPRILQGRYQLGEVLGRGGMAEVRRARDLRLGRDVAVKQLRVDLASDPTFQERFRREAQSAAGLNHPNIVAVYDTGEDPDPISGVKVPYIVMELVEGRTLRDLLRTGRKIVPTKALEFVRGILDALSYSHKAGIIHRDIKPANVMLTTDGTVKVMDFGIARAVADTSSTMTQTAAVIGTAQYLSPEQARGETVDSRSDIYSAGCLLYELLVGRPPFQGDSPVSVAYQHVREAPVPPSHLDPMITPAMDAITLKALAKDPEDRYQTAAAMRSDLTRLLAGQEVSARPPVPTVLAPSSSLTPAAYEPTTVLASNPNPPIPSPTTASMAPVATKPKRRVWPLAVFLSVLAVVAVGFVVYFATLPEQVEMVTVPKVEGRQQADAEFALTDNHLKPVVVPVTGADDDTKGRVIRQSIPGGNRVAIGTEVTIEVNIGPAKGQIPTNLVGTNVDDAIAQLTALGFSNTRPIKDPSEPLTAKANEVTNVDPQPGQTVNMDALITVYYATGESAVPNFKGLTQEEAIAQAVEAGFPSPKFTTAESLETPGTVISQSPVLGKVEKRTTVIKLVLAVAPPTPTATPTESETPTTTPTSTP
jgi:Serine/threonine protein kinase